MPEEKREGMGCKEAALGSLVTAPMVPTISHLQIGAVQAERALNKEERVLCFCAWVKMQLNSQLSKRREE